jgi:glycosyltransferase involved in cell wall biosynthesis
MRCPSCTATAASGSASGGELGEPLVISAAIARVSRRYKGALGRPLVGAAVDICCGAGFTGVVTDISLTAASAPAPASRAPSPTPGETPHGPSRRLLSIVVPVYAEAANLTRLWARLCATLASLSTYEWEVIFVNDGSPDDSLAKLASLAARDPRCRVVDLSRNFGKEIALTAGLDVARGEAVIFMDADLQHPPELIAQMVSVWNTGAEVVVTVRRHSEGEPIGRRLGSALFHWFMAKFTELEMLARTTDFRLLDAKVVHAMRQIGERERLFRGLVDWLGFRRAILEFDAPSRPAEQKTTYSYARLGGLALSSFVSHSLLPLKLVGALGVLVTTLSGLLLIWMLVAERLVDKRFYYTPLAQVVVANTLLIGVVLTALGVMSLYLAKVYREVLRRPLYAVRQTVNVHPRQDGREP